MTLTVKERRGEQEYPAKQTLPITWNDRQNMKITIVVMVTALMFAATVVAGQSSRVGDERGELLYSTYCIGCHTTQGLCAQPPPRTPARLVARADGRARCALVPACALREIGRSKGRNSAENSAACMNCHAIDDAPRGSLECR
jgi:cytochrome c553